MKHHNPALLAIIAKHSEPPAGERGLHDVVDEHAEPDGMQEHDKDGVDASHALMEALKSGDAMGVWKAFKAASMCADAMPHVEGEHEAEPAGESGEEDGMAHGGMC